MQPFTVFEAVAAPMPDAEVDTDILFPARFLTLTQKHGLGRYAFHDKRYDEAGRERPDFVLNRAPWKNAGILVAGPNFGCGSSREQAPWALADLGIRCIVAPGFGAIFEANCRRNGLLPVVVGDDDHRASMAHAMAGGAIRVDLLDCTVRFGEHEIRFAIPEAARHALVDGVDEIDVIRRDEGPAIAAFEARQRQRMPWLYPSSD